jgi:hypothetical protein
MGLNMLKKAFAEEHQCLSWVHELTEGRRKTWYLCLHCAELYSAESWKEETVPMERNSGASQKRPLARQQ